MVCLRFLYLVACRYIMDRICEDFGVICSLDPKPMAGVCVCVCAIGVVANGIITDVCV